MVALLIAGATSACVGTRDAQVRIMGTLEGAPSDSPCQLFLVAASEKGAPLKYGRDIRGSFSQWFTVHPWDGPYSAVVKCGDRITMTKDIEYRELGTDPYNLGSIAL